MDSRIAAFLPPSWHAERDRRRKKYIEERLKDAVAWDEDKTKLAKWMFLKGDTFTETNRQYELFDVQPVKNQYGNPGDEGYVFSPKEEYVYFHRILPRGADLEVAQGTRHGNVAFDGKTYIVTVCRTKANFDSRRPVVMSITPLEVLTQRKAIMLAKGKVLIGGLGLGWLLKKVAAKKSVKEIVVVEISRELLDWYGNKLCADVAKKFNTPVDVIHDDVTKHVGKHGAETRHLLDIWDSYPNYLHGELEERAKKVPYFWGWGVVGEFAV